MPPATKKRKAAKQNCDGDGCGQPTCTSCWLDSDDMDFLLPSGPGIEKMFLHEATPAAVPNNNAMSSTMSSWPFRPAALAAATAAARAVAVQVDLEDMVAALDADVVRRLLVDIAPGNPQLLRSIKAAHEECKAASRAKPATSSAPKRKRAAKPAPAPSTPAPSTPGRISISLSQMAPVVDFDHLSKRAWHALNDQELLQLSEWEQVEQAGSVSLRIRQSIEEITSRVKSDSPLQMKRNAIETLRKIMKTVVLSESALADEVRVQQKIENRIGDFLVNMLMSMTPAERVATGARLEKGESLLEKFRWVKSHQNPRGLFQLDDVVVLLESGHCVVVVD